MSAVVSVADVVRILGATACYFVQSINGDYVTVAGPVGDLKQRIRIVGRDELELVASAMPVAVEAADDDRCPVCGGPL